MLKYTLQRILYMFIVFMIITLMCFVLIRMLPLAPPARRRSPHGDRGGTAGGNGL